MTKTSLFTIPIILLILLTPFAAAMAMMGGNMGDSSNNHMDRNENQNDQQGYYNQHSMNNQNMDHDNMDRGTGQNMADDFFKD